MILKNNKIVPVAILVVAILAGFLALAHLHRLNAQMPVFMGPALAYLSVFICVLCSFFLYLDSGKTIKVVETIQSDAELQAVEKDKGKKEKKEEKTDEISKSAIRETVQRILPAKSSSPSEYCENLLINISNELNFVQGICYIKNLEDGMFASIALYAYYSDKKPEPFAEGETLPGQVAKDQKIRVIVNIPEEYMKVLSGLGTSVPRILIFVPVVHDEQTIAVLELASFKQPEPWFEELFENLGNKIDDILFNFIKVPEKTRNDKK